ncbi:uncharacterized protein NPIL_684932 [Nephila pilipes]|uniref:Uncharacterized protein n=1 Tax=Nephila pilipes TaxID=299642 RepID=A0A8X6PCI7_NEPPI|nr:uncharacterized protein NPIL_684932 [Nephila pilipes]
MYAIRFNLRHASSNNLGLQVKSVKFVKDLNMEDSRPFSTLRENADKFRSLFDENIKTCLTSLDSQISTLLRDPDSFSTSYGNAKALNAHMEFSKAKYEIFVKMQSLFDEMETNWIENIAEMKASFLENVEIFLAGTKLEVSFPSSNTSSVTANKRSPVKKSGGRPSPAALSPASSLYPKLISSAKKQISMLSSLLPHADDKDSSDDSEEKQISVTPVRLNGRSPKRVTIVTPEEMETVENSEEIQESESDEEEQPILTPARRGGRFSQKLTPSTPASLKVPAKSSLRKPMTLPEKDSSDSSSTDDKSDTEQPVIQSRGRKSTRSQLSTSTVATPSSTPGRKTRTPRKKSNASEVQSQLDILENKMEYEENNDYISKPVTPRTPKNVHFSVQDNDDIVVERTSKDMQFSVGMDINEDLDVYSPDVKLSRATPRRKTVVTPKLMENFDDANLTPNSVRGKSKRRTIAGSVLDDSVAPSPKRLKRGGRSSMAQPTFVDDSADANLLESDGISEPDQYTPWMPLADISGSVPSQPGVYELKVSAAKKPAYIGGCENLRQKLTLHKLKHNSGHKHLDKFIDRNLANIFVRYEQLSSAAEAKSEEKIRVNAFVSSYKNTPAYN